MAARDKNNHKLPPINREDVRDATINATIPAAATVAGDLLVPGLGGIAGGLAGSFFAGIVGSIVRPTIEARAADWYDMVEDGLKELQEKRPDFNIDNLATRETFTSTLLTALPIALRTEHEEKRKALRNAVLNSTLPNSPKSDTLQLFLRMIDEFGPSHLRLLKYFHNPHAYIRRFNDPEYAERIIRETRLMDAFRRHKDLDLPPEEIDSSLDFSYISNDQWMFDTIREQRYKEMFLSRLFPYLGNSLYNALFMDLQARGLIRSDPVSEIDYLETVALSKRLITWMGQDFLRFIEDPTRREGV